MFSDFLRQYWGRARHAVNVRLPDKPVRRTVRGVDMLLPRRHALPYFARSGVPYAENMLQLGRVLADTEGEVCMLDVGANVGDSARFMLEQVPGTVVCVEADPAWQRYLHANVGEMPNVAVEPSVLVGPDADRDLTLAIVHADVGSSIVTRAADGEGLQAITPDELLARHPQLAEVRLIKSDTDGYDVMLVPTLMRTFLPSRPIIFFEFDPVPTRITTPELEPSEIWGALSESGYEHSVVWDNGGTLLGSWSTDQLLERSAVLDGPADERGYAFWDVAVAHKDDETGLKALESFLVQR